MLPNQRLVLVALEFDDFGKKKRKIAITLPAIATNADLAEEVAKTANTNRESISLEIHGGFQLRDQDAITVGPEEIVTARILSQDGSLESEPLAKEFQQSPGSLKRKVSLPPTNELSGTRILLVTAEMGRRCANAHPADTNEPTEDFGIYAFEGASVDGALTLGNLKREAANALRLTNPASTTDVDYCSQCKLQIEETCACAISNKIKVNGLLSSMHCRLSIDGKICANGDECPYSHEAIDGMDNKTPPHCIMCEGALGFPCHRCQPIIAEMGIEPGEYPYCPLIANAGCNHLQHAHCMHLHFPESEAFKRNSEAALKISSCPTGCPRLMYPLEPKIFGLSGPHVILAWDGPDSNPKKILYVPIPEHLCPSSGQAHAFSLDTSAIVAIVRDYFVEQGIATPECGLTVQVHNRDPTTEKVLLTQSTLVTVCASSSHRVGFAGRFELFAPCPSYDTENPSSSLDRGSNNAFEIDFHTSTHPVLSACDCNTLEDLKLINPSSTDRKDLVLYVVQRRVANTSTTSSTPTAGKDTFLDNPAWHPAEATQTPRGIACLLSSLFVLSKVVQSRLRNSPEQWMRSVLSLWYMITRFPPAVRSLALIMENMSLLPEEQAALGSAVYHSLKAFAYGAPTAIVNKDERTYETARILLGWIMKEASKSSSSSTDSALERISLTCSASGNLNRLRDPVHWGGGISERGFVLLHLPGAELYRPPYSPTDLPTEDLYTKFRDLDPDSLLPKVIRATRGLKQKYQTRTESFMVLHTNQIGKASSATRLEIAGRDFVQAIQWANESENMLSTRGPLDLKAPSIIAPQLVLDSEGFIAVFTGRGCGSARDVNFFRPTASGDTEVDINTVAHALDAIIPARKAEKTWEIDTFTSVEVPLRDPTEAVVLALDLSQSMNSRSGVEDTSSQREDRITRKLQENRRLEEILEGMTDEEILDEACTFLQNQHWSTRAALNSHWDYLQMENLENLQSDPESDLEEDYLESFDLLRHGFLRQLATVARLDLQNADQESKDSLRKIASFAKACEDWSTDSMERLMDIIDDNSDHGSHMIGTEPFALPREFMDLKTGNVLENPVHLPNTPTGVYVNESSRAFFEELPYFPEVLFIPSRRTERQLKAALADWHAGKDLLPLTKKRLKNGSDESIEINLQHQNKTFTWKLDPKTTTTRTLYSLVNRAVGAEYSYFLLRVKNSRALIIDSQSIHLSSSLAIHDGCEIEVTNKRPHERTPFVITFDDLSDTLILPSDATVMALFALVQSFRYPISETSFWHSMREVGDGTRQGRPVSASFGIATSRRLSWHFCPAHHKLECKSLYVPRTVTQESRHLTRLHLLKELFNVFLNRACSFDTTTPLVLGLVTFSDKATVTQEMTPLFEKFREELDRVEARGDTAVYDALDVARSMLVNYRTDLPNLRRRIIMVSDGEDTCSKESAVEVLGALQKAKIMVDSVQVGTTVDAALHGIAVVTGGYRCCPRTSLSDALSIFDLETMLDSSERPVRPLVNTVVNTLYSLTSRYGNTTLYPIDVVTLDEFPKRAEHPKLFNRVKPSQSLDVVGRAKDERITRIMREMKNLMKEPAPYMDLYFDESDITFWRIVMEAPEDVGCLYRNGVFLLTCEFPDGYPKNPPKIRFVNFIMHPNVSKQGKVCIAELGRLWSSDTSMETALKLVYQIFMHLDLENPLETQASMRYYDDDGRYALAVANAVSSHASKTRGEWKAELADE